MNFVRNKLNSVFQGCPSQKRMTQKRSLVFGVINFKHNCKILMSRKLLHQVILVMLNKSILFTCKKNPSKYGGHLWQKSMFIFFTFGTFEYHRQPVCNMKPIPNENLNLFLHLFYIFWLSQVEPRPTRQDLRFEVRAISIVNQ